MFAGSARRFHLGRCVFAGRMPLRILGILSRKSSTLDSLLFALTERFLVNCYLSLK